jgi:hypothetical protein
VNWSSRVAFFIVVAFLLFTVSGGYAAQWKNVFAGKSAIVAGPKVPVNTLASTTLPSLPAIPVNTLSATQPI